ncbi:sensor domain-containing diguanylate cyclase [Noviherbaspirillum sp.]|jgi:diguanylate cyclase (GGDEF)-like protein|uniref:sensor domain-containing diguanylate cyclase n=1 Tax=Noviherbaspirillum sp. TaxID=1926288 RepID=UPI0025DA86A9|nr:sensor domain-containing diguanylate cyclase [Noviherbaspirillum sp.]
MTRVDSAKHTDTSILRPEQADVLNGDVDQQMLRISRIGKTLFDVANCVIRFGDTPPVFPDGVRSIESIETAFCYGMSLQDEPVVAPDTRSHSLLGQHRAVTGAPYIRFYASHPVYNGDKALVGSINLVDYAPRPAFRERDIQLLADLAALVERELHLRLINASQLDLQKKNKNLRRKSLIDPLIGTWNRGAIMRILTIEAVRCDKAGVPLSLIVADLDFFKKINDTYGHPAGDTVLVKVASRLRSCIRPQEALGRYGGEEFLIVLPGSSHSTAMAVAERMRLAIVSQPEVIGGTTLNLTISAGVASTDLFPTATTEELISRADMALYAAKDAGRNRVVKATPDLS